jgi:hypothetical protein
MSKRLSKIILALPILSAATALWIPHQRTLAAARTALTDTRAQHKKFEERITAATTGLESARTELHGLQNSRKQTRSAIEKAEAELSRTDPEAHWATPPESLPDWNTQSPYVWLRKDILPKLPIQAFTENGALKTEVASVLMLDQNQKTALNTTLTSLLAEYHSLEAAKAQKTDEHLPGIADQKGDKVTIRVEPQPEDGQRLMQQFQTALRNQIGEQRADLMLKASEMWLDEQFSQSGAEPKTISILRHPDGSYSLSIKSGASWFSTGGPWRNIKSNIPVHLRQMFSDIIPAQPDQSSQ